jgi:hypothetical protein
VESYIPEAQESTIDVPEVKPVESLFIIVKSSAPGTLESTVDIPEAFLANVIEASLVESTSILLKL